MRVRPQGGARTQEDAREVITHNYSRPGDRNASSVSSNLKSYASDTVSKNEEKGIDDPTGNFHQ